MCQHINISMVNMTLSIPNNVHNEMKKFSEIRWSEVARKAIITRLETLKLAEQLSKKSKLTKKDIEDFDKLIKSSASTRFFNEDNS